jgi:uncharacterized protein (DUF697 family)
MANLAVFIAIFRDIIGVGVVMKKDTQQITTFYSGLTAATAFVTQPVPALDELVIIPLQYRLCSRLARARGVEAKSLPWKQIQRIIWYGACARLVANFSLGLVPVVGMFSNAITAIVLTGFLGRYIDGVLANPDVPPPEVTLEGVREMFADALRRYHAERGAVAPPAVVTPARPGRGSTQRVSVP